MGACFSLSIWLTYPVCPTQEFKAGKSPIMLATDVAARGLGIQLSKHHALPWPCCCTRTSMHSSLLDPSCCMACTHSLTHPHQVCSSLSVHPAVFRTVLPTLPCWGVGKPSRLLRSGRGGGHLQELPLSLQIRRVMCRLQGHRACYHMCPRAIGFSGFIAGHLTAWETSRDFAGRRGIGPCWCAGTATAVSGTTDRAVWWADAASNQNGCFVPQHPTPFQDAAVPLTGCTPARRGSPPALPCAPQRRREGHQDGGQLRHAGHGRGLCAPHRPHRARRGERPRRQLLHGRQRAPRAAGAPPPPSHLTCPQGSRLRACIMGDGCGIWSLARCVKLGLESCKVCGVQVLDILAEAQQPVPEQLRQYASVAGGGGGGAQFPHAQCCLCLFEHGSL